MRAKLSYPRRTMTCVGESAGQTTDNRLNLSCTIAPMKLFRIPQGEMTTDTGDCRSAEFCVWMVIGARPLGLPKGTGRWTGEYRTHNTEVNG